MKLALAHDWLKTMTGAERVLIELHKIFPDSPIYTLFYDKKFVNQYLPNADIRPSFLQKVPAITKVYALLGFLMPSAIQAFDLSGFDKVLSSSIIFPKGLVLKPSTRHICYCYSPTRRLWDHNISRSSENQSDFNWPRLFIKHLFRLWDRTAAARVDQYIAISKTVQERIKKYYRRDSVVIYPPNSKLNYNLDLDHDDSNPKANVRRRVAEKEQKIQQDFYAVRRGLNHRDYYHHGYYLIVSRLYKYKNIDIAIESFSRLGYPLVIIGSGPDGRRLKRSAKGFKNIEFLGFVPDEELASYYSNCRAFIMPQEEDFGLTAIEAMSHGKPVIALKIGGATETIIDGQTGIFFDDPIPEALADAVRRFDESYSKFNPETIKTHALQFSPENFKASIMSIIGHN